MQKAKEYMRVGEVAECLGVSVRTVWMWARAGELKSVKIAKKITIFRKVDIDEFIVKKINETLVKE